MTFVLTKTTDKKRLLIVMSSELFPLPLETSAGELTEGKIGVTVCGTSAGVARTMVWIEIGSV